MELIADYIIFVGLSHVERTIHWTLKVDDGSITPNTAIPT